MSHRQLLTQVQTAIELNSRQALFVVLYTYFSEPARVRVAENRLKLAKARLPAEPVDLQRRRGPGYLPHWLTPIDETRPIDQVHRELSLLTDTDEFEVQALRWLRRFDEELGIAGRQLFNQQDRYAGFDNRNYWVRPVNRRLADRIEDIVFARSGKRTVITWSGVQAPTIKAYCRRMTALPVAESVSQRCVPVALAERSPLAAARLSLEWQRGNFAVILWPFSVPLKFPNELRDVVVLTELTNSGQVLANALRAIDEAKEEKAAILIYPELSISEEIEYAIRNRLRTHGPNDYPILTVLGRTHRKRLENEEESCLNEALVLGPIGEEVQIHRKMTCFVDAKTEVRESISTGSSVTVLECDWGNLATVICLDFLQSEVKAQLRTSGYANMFLVPSLSPTTKAHLASADELFIEQLASSFVCNRWLSANGDSTDSIASDPISANSKEAQELLQRGASFCRLPHPDAAIRLRIADPSRHSHLVFNLRNVGTKPP
ncbi:MAG: nitrilase-related carbon-nitrogen hydrolase [Pirellulaceae bacterium]|nr:nitrilase-related carbon-nitrogen hydrolase [Pirellulaceae bacterium]